MKVLYVVSHAEIIGGGEYSFFDLATGCRDAGVSVAVAVPGPGAVQMELEMRGIPVHQVGMPKLKGSGLLFYRRNRRQLKNLFRAVQPDLVHVDGARAMLYAGPAAKRGGIPCCWHVRVLERDGWIDRFRARYADRIIANSLAVRDSLLPFAGDVPVELVYNGFPIKQMQETSAQELATLPDGPVNAPPGPVILTAARLSPEKGHEILLQALALLKQRGISFTALIAGKDLNPDQSMLKKMKQVTVSLNLEESVFFTGQLDPIAGWMKTCDILAVPSIAEPFGRIVIEAWASGLPIVATRAGGPAELIEHGKTGLLVHPGDSRALADALQQLCEQPNLRKQLRENGTIRAELFNLSHCISRTLELYEQVTQSATTQQ